MLKGVPGITFVYFDEHDVVRHRPGVGHHPRLRAPTRRSARRPGRRPPAPARDDEATAGAVLMPAAIDNRQHRVPVAVGRASRPDASPRALAAVGRAAGNVEVAVVDDARDPPPERAPIAASAAAPTCWPSPSRLPTPPASSSARSSSPRHGARGRPAAWACPLALELDLLVTHGILHLVGLRRPRPAWRPTCMHRRERDLLAPTAPARLWTGLLPRAVSGGALRASSEPASWRSIGRPNAGKSTLLNRLVGREAGDRVAAPPDDAQPHHRHPAPARRPGRSSWTPRACTPGGGKLGRVHAADRPSGRWRTWTSSASSSTPPSRSAPRRSGAEPRSRAYGGTPCSAA